ncbi:MAG: Spi family protease inhibitor, partial [Bacteroidaceae bacterium]|nr:Spi family protease inhibitor [Bacteroidaceae bacterium]
MRQRLILLLAVLWAGCGATWADEISTDKALQIARQFTENTASLSSRARLAAHRAELSLAHVVKSKSTQQDNVYVINLGSDGGFIIVAGDDRADAEVLGYCDHGSFDYAAAPIQLRYLLEGYAAQIDS